MCCQFNDTGRTFVVALTVNKLDNFSFGQYTKIQQYKNDEYLEVKQAILIFVKDADLFSKILNVCYQMKSYSFKPIQLNPESSILWHEQDLPLIYENAIMDSNDRCRKQISYFQSHFKEIDQSLI